MRSPNLWNIFSPGSYPGGPLTLSSARAKDTVPPSDGAPEPYDKNLIWKLVVLLVLELIHMLLLKADISIVASVTNGTEKS